jgi:Glyoxalase/Bleomycin resistance protein/Dioxygenase superfamily
MSTPELYHVGILVFDLEGAIGDFSAALGVDFEPPRELSLDGRLARNDFTCERKLWISYSTSGAMRVELIEAQPDGVWGRQHGEGVHHMGAWEGDRVAAIARHLAAGRSPEITMGTGAEVSSVYFPPATLHGVRLELVNRFTLPGGEPDAGSITPSPR